LKLQITNSKFQKDIEFEVVVVVEIEVEVEVPNSE